LPLCYSLSLLVALPISALALGAGLVGSSVLLDVADDEAGHVLAGGRLYALQSRRGVDLHYHRTVVGAQDIHPCDVQPHHLGRAQDRKSTRLNSSHVKIS